MSLQTHHDSRHRISGTPVQKPLFFFPSTRRRLNMPRARRGLWRRERAGIDASSMTVKPACNGKSRRKSWSMLLEWPPALHHTTAFARSFDRDPCRSPTLHAICFKPRRVPAHDAWLGTHLVRTVVRRQRRHRQGYAQKTRDFIRRDRKKVSTAPLTCQGLSPRTKANEFRACL